MRTDIIYLLFLKSIKKSDYKILIYEILLDYMGMKMKSNANDIFLNTLGVIGVIGLVFLIIMLIIVAIAISNVVR